MDPGADARGDSSRVLAPRFGYNGAVAAGGEEKRGAVAGRRCSHCGRAVRETRHTRESWWVDYYLLRTGEVEMATVAREDETGLLSFLKLVSTEDVVTCIDCYRDPDVRSEREERFRPERQVEGER